MVVDAMFDVGLDMPPLSHIVATMFFQRKLLPFFPKWHKKKFIFYYFISLPQNSP
jgi:hypothetical protein